MKKLLKIKFIFYAYMIILFLGTIIPINSVSPSLNDNYTLHIRWDYLLHALVYMPLPVLLAMALKKGFPEKSIQQNNKTKFWIRIVLITLVITSLLESLQLIIPYRAFNLNDLVANWVGAIFGLMLILIFRKTYTRVASILASTEENQ